MELGITPIISSGMVFQVRFEVSFDEIKDADIRPLSFLPAPILSMLT